MREMSVREANQNFSQVIAAAERGETVRAEPFAVLPLKVGVLFGDEDDEAPAP